MNKQIKAFVAGVIVTLLLVSTGAFASEIKSTIQVVLNSVNLTVNDSKVEADNILYKGTTYVPIRAVSQMLGKTVGWDADTNTANIHDAESLPSSKPPISIEQIPYKTEILNADSAGIVWINSSYTNNTKYPITSFRMSILRKDINKINYLTNTNTVMPGETSPISKTFGPESQKDEDIEILKIEIRAQGENDKELVIIYDTKLDKYEYQ